MTDAHGPDVDPADDEPDPRLVATLGIAKTLKEQTVRREGTGADFAPMVELRRDGVLLTLAVLDGERDRTLMLLENLVALSDADQAVVICDAYGFSLPVDETPDDFDLEVGELARRFAAGDPTVYECIQLMSSYGSGTGSAMQVQYTYDRRRVTWGEQKPLLIPHEDGGAFPARLRRGFEAQAKRPGPGLEPQVIADMFRCVLAVPLLSAPPRNRPCPCGSGTKAKHCCWGDW